MKKFIFKNKLLATTAICAISMCANTVKAEEISILDILNNSTTKSPDITWTTEGATSDDIEILGKYYKYIISANPTRTKYDERKTNLTGDVTADFVGISSGSEGGAIYNYNNSTISSITGDFVGNSATSTSGSTGGGAINNDGTISSIIGDFTGNSANATHSFAHGGAVSNWETIEFIIGDFVGNTVTSTNSHAYGGAIYNNVYYDSNGNSSNGAISNITGDFIGNSAIGNEEVVGGAIFNNNGTISYITGDFTGNSATATHGSAIGGAIANGDTIEAINGEFIENSVTGEHSYGGAIYNNGIIEKLSGDFIGNTATSRNYQANGGAIYNDGKTILQYVIQNLLGYKTFEEYAQDMWGMSGGDLLAEYGLSSETEVTPEITMYMITGSLTVEDFVSAMGYDSLEDMLDDYGCSSIQEIPEILGLHDMKATMALVADASDSTDALQDDILFQGNYAEDEDGKRYEAIYNAGTICFESNNGGSFTFYDYINGNGTGTINLTGDGNGTFNLYNDIKGQGTVDFKSAYVMNMISPDDIHVGTSKYSYIQAQNVNINAALQMMLDVDLENAEMDRFEAENFTIADGGSIDVTKFNIVTDVTGDIGTTTEVEFILSDNATGLENITNVTEAVGEIYTYSVTFNPETGAFEFVSTGLAPEPVEPVTPAPEEVAPNQAPALTTTTTVATVETVVTQIFDRDVTISTDTNYGADTTDYVETADGVNIHNNKSLWVKTFGSDDDVKVENFSNTIDAEAYGVVAGVDSKVFKYDNGVKAAYGVYGAYVGGKQKYNDSKITQDSGYLGVSASFRKNNLFSNFTLNGGYITSEANTEWGTDKFDTKTISVANKTGVDIKVGNSWTFTPALYVAYTGLDTEDYTNKAGVKMENEFTHVVTLAPEVKLGRYFGKGFSGYAKASYKHYIYDSEVKADDVVLEEMSAKPYVEYGFGVEKNWADKSGYAELTRRDGGREGWNINLGLKLDF